MIRTVCLVLALLSTLPAVTDRPMSAAHLTTHQASGVHAGTIRGVASWYRAASGVAAAGPALRRALGPDWRGSLVRVCAGRCVTVRLTDWCGCSDRRVIDLDDDAFRELAPLAVGVLEVTVSPVLPPSTDTEGAIR